jgi:hypothetical protein
MNSDYTVVSWCPGDPCDPCKCTVWPADYGPVSETSPAVAVTRDIHYAAIAPETIGPVCDPSAFVSFDSSAIPQYKPPDGWFGGYGAAGYWVPVIRWICQQQTPPYTMYDVIAPWQASGAINVWPGIFPDVPWSDVKSQGSAGNPVITVTCAGLSWTSTYSTGTTGSASLPPTLISYTYPTIYPAVPGYSGDSSWRWPSMTPMGGPLAMSLINGAFWPPSISTSLNAPLPSLYAKTGASSMIKRRVRVPLIGIPS